jgi:alpha-tubulin suppressor-like RCC1 family protein
MRAPFALFFASLVACGDPHEVPREVDANLSLGFAHSCLGLADGRIACWGRGRQGELGDGRSSDSATPVWVLGLFDTRVLSLSQSTCARRGDDVWCWGPLDGARLRSTEQPRPVLQRHRTVDFQLGLRYLCSLNPDGVAKCNFGAGPETTFRPQRVAPETVRVIEEHVCFLERGAGIECLDRRDPTSEENRFMVAEGDRAVVMTSGPYAGTLLHEDGRLYQWDSWRGGEALPVADANQLVALGPAAQASFHVCALDGGGRVYCQGSNGEGQLGRGMVSEHEPELAPVLGIDDAVAVATGAFHSCAVRRTGKVSCWGNNERGQLGDGTTRDRLLPVDVIGVDLRATERGAEPVIEQPVGARCLLQDEDGDGIEDRREDLSMTDDGDGIPARLDDDSDGDGLSDRDEWPFDACGVPIDIRGVCANSAFSLDADRDGLRDVDEPIEARCARDADEDGCSDLAASEGDCAELDATIYVPNILSHGGDMVGWVELTVTVDVADPLAGIEAEVIGTALTTRATAAPYSDLSVDPRVALHIEVDHDGRFVSPLAGTDVERAEIVLRSGGEEVARGRIWMVLEPGVALP